MGKLSQGITASTIKYSWHHQISFRRYLSPTFFLGKLSLGMWQALSNVPGTIKYFPWQTFTGNSSKPHNIFLASSNICHQIFAIKDLPRQAFTRNHDRHHQIFLASSNICHQKYSSQAFTRNRGKHHQTFSLYV